MHFTKMQGLGNDYLYFYGPVPENVRDLAIKYCDRHFGPGADGLIFISKGAQTDFCMRIFNADGSEAEMCGNGIRCVGKYVYEKGLTRQTHLTVATGAGLRTLDLQVKNEKVASVTVEMGKALVSPPVTLSVGERELSLRPVSVGNPHAVCFVEDAEACPLAEVGPKVEKHPYFPQGVNAEFVSRTGPQALRMRVWERGSGITLACGTGACAAAAAACSAGLCAWGEPVAVQLDGGILTVTVQRDGELTMTGPAEFVCEIEI